MLPFQRPPIWGRFLYVNLEGEDTIHNGPLEDKTHGV